MKKYWFTTQNSGDTLSRNPGAWILDDAKYLKRFKNFKNSREGDAIAIYEKGEVVALTIIKKKYPRGHREGPDKNGKYWRRFADVVVTSIDDFSMKDIYCILSGNNPASPKVMAGYLRGKYVPGVVEIGNKTFKEISRQANQNTINTSISDNNEEGKQYRAERAFRQRNATLIAQKKRTSDYRCEVCNRRYEEIYGVVGRRFIVAHHLEPIGNRFKPSPTRLEDIALVCSNCHDMLHRGGMPNDLEKLRRIIKQSKTQK